MTPATVHPSELLAPLASFAEAAEGPHLAAVEAPADALPEPQRSLLVHERDMTGTLEGYLGQPLVLRVFAKRTGAETLSRLVVLEGADTGRRVEFGAIHIDLSCFPAAARDVVLACRTPLGRVLRDFGVAYVSSPLAYLRVEPDDFVRRALRYNAGVLFGRRNRLVSPRGGVIADILEVLPPLPPAGEP